MRVLEPSDASEDLLVAIRRVMVDAFEGSFSEADWDHTQGGWRVVMFDDERPVSHAAVVPRTLAIGGVEFQSGYVEGVATAPDSQRQGLASAVMTEVAEIVRDHYELGALSTGHHTFYERLGWERWRGPSFVRDGAALVRTPDEDDGLMVLRFGSSSAIDLAATISCDWRAGDAW
jgi:aminoglycoside 2'-N-acetyltransferase I